MKIIIKSLIAVGSILVGWIVLSALLAGQSSNIVFKNEVSWSKDNKLTEDPVYIQNSDGNRIQIISNQNLNSFKYNSTDESEYILYLHGNAGRLDNIVTGFGNNPNIVMISPAYPGYHESEGSPSVENVYKTALDTYDYMVKSIGIPENKITIFGHSLGGSTATYLAAQKPNAKRLVIANTFSSIQSLCWKQYSIFCAFTGGIFNSAKNAESVTIPVFQFHYKGDKTVPFDEGKTLHTYFKSAKDKKFVELTGATHSILDFDTIFSELKINR